MAKGISGHKTDTTIGINDEWLSPPEIVKALGPFDLDPCSPVIRPWATAAQHYTVHDNGLLLPWHGRVWMNPPYGRSLPAWLNKMCLHGDGIGLTFSKTEIKAFQNYVYPHAASIFFFYDRLTFYNVDGTKADYNAGDGSCLIGYGKRNMEAIGDSGLRGKHLLINYTPVILVGVDRTWRTVVSMTMERLDGVATLDAIYTVVENLAPEKVRRNDHYKAKVRQTLQLFFTKIKKGQYTNVSSTDQEESSEI